MRRSIALLAVVVLLVSTVATPVAAASSSDLGADPLPLQTNNSTTSNGTTENATTPPAEPPDEPPTEKGVAESARIVPVAFDEDWLSTSRRDRSVYNTTGPFAVFTSSEPVTSATIEETGARATRLANGGAVKITYAGGGSGGTSLYTLRLGYADGSTRVIKLYASGTTVDVNQGLTDEYRPVLLDMINEAENEGYERSPEGLERYHTRLKERSELLESMFTEQAKRWFASVLSLITNPLGILSLLVAAALGVLWLYRNHGRTLDILSTASSRLEDIRRQIRLDARESVETAAEEHLREIDEIGNFQIYWEDAFDVSTTWELAELFRQGIPVRTRDENGDPETVLVGGVDTLDAGDIAESWLEPVTRPKKLASPEIALSHGRQAVHRMMTRYGRVSRYQETYEKIRELEDELDTQGTEIATGFTTDANGLGRGTPAGGDDD